MSAKPSIRSDLRPGDLGEIVRHHGRRYAAERGVDPTFEAHVAASVAAAGKRGFPGPREALRIVELGGRHAGSVALTDEGDGLAMLRWVLLDESLRGHGLGRSLIGELVDEARRFGYRTVALETFSELRAAAEIYRELGFEIRWEKTGPRWGRESLTYQRYELELQPRAHSRSRSSTGSSDRPFSVSA